MDVTLIVLSIDVTCERGLAPPGRVILGIGRGPPLTLGLVGDVARGDIGEVFDDLTDGLDDWFERMAGGNGGGAIGSGTDEGYEIGRCSNDESRYGL